MTTTVDTTPALTDTEQRLVDRYSADGVPPEHVRALVEAAHERLDGARISSFVPILVERSVHRALAG
jgi:hypothetical protein